MAYSDVCKLELERLLKIFKNEKNEKGRPLSQLEISKRMGEDLDIPSESVRAWIKNLKSGGKPPIRKTPKYEEKGRIETDDGKVRIILGKRKAADLDECLVLLRDFGDEPDPVKHTYLIPYELIPKLITVLNKICESEI